MCIRDRGKNVYVIMGARTKDLLILHEQFDALPLAGQMCIRDSIMSSAAFAVPVSNAAPMTRGTAVSSAISRTCPHVPLKRISLSLIHI